jgi:hypothetical protein
VIHRRLARSTSGNAAINYLPAMLRRLLLCTVSMALTSAAPGRTHVALVEGRWHIDGAVTFPGTPAEGLLPNVRMVNAVFEDDRPRSQWPATLPADFDPDANTAAFLARLPDYRAHGVRAFTISLQGGHAGYEGPHNSAFESDGTLRPDYLARVRRVIAACDEAGMVVILSCFYQRQHGLAPTHLPRALHGREALRRAVAAVATWVREEGWGNVLLEIANEYAHSGFGRWVDGDWLRTPAAQVELIELARSLHPRLLIATSGMGDGRIAETIGTAADFVTLHFNNTPLDRYAERIAAAQAAFPGKPIVVNEDNKTGAAGALAGETALRAGASWGYMGSAVNQYAPFEFRGAGDDPAVYAMFAALTGAQPTPPAIDGAGLVAAVVLARPGDGESFPVGVAIDLEAAVAVPLERGIAAVRFVAGGRVLGEAVRPPWRWQWADVPAGRHDLTARVVFADGQQIVSPPVDIEIDAH